MSDVSIFILSIFMVSQSSCMLQLYSQVALLSNTSQILYLDTPKELSCSRPQLASAFHTRAVHQTRWCVIWLEKENRGKEDPALDSNY